MIDYDDHSSIFYGIGPTTSWRRISRDLLVDLRKGARLSKTKKTKKTKLSILKVRRVMALHLKWCHACLNECGGKFVASGPPVLLILFYTLTESFVEAYSSG